MQRNERNNSFEKSKCFFSFLGDFLAHVFALVNCESTGQSHVPFFLSFSFFLCFFLCFFLVSFLFSSSFWWTGVPEPRLSRTIPRHSPYFFASLRQKPLSRSPSWGGKTRDGGFAFWCISPQIWLFGRSSCYHAAFINSRVYQLIDRHALR